MTIYAIQWDSASISYEEATNRHVVSGRNASSYLLEVGVNSALTNVKGDIEEVERFVTRYATKHTVADKNLIEGWIPSVLQVIVGLGKALQAFKTEKDQSASYVQKLSSAWTKNKRETTSSLIRRVQDLGATLETQGKRFAVEIGKASRDAEMSSLGLVNKP